MMLIFNLLMILVITSMIPIFTEQLVQADSSTVLAMDSLFHAFNQLMFFVVRHLITSITRLHADDGKDVSVR